MLEFSNIVDQDGDIFASQRAVQRTVQVFSFRAGAQSTKIIDDVVTLDSEFLDLILGFDGIIFILVNEEDIETILGELESISLANSRCSAYVIKLQGDSVKIEQ